MKYLRLAVSFLTILPTRPVNDYRKGDIGRAAAFFPWVGLILSILVLAANTLFRLFLPLNLTAVLSVSLLAMLTGFLHLDGLSDCSDALPVATTKERRLEIMKDSRVGSFALVSLILFFLVKTTAFMNLQELSFWRFAFTITSTVVLARWMMVLLSATQTNARPGGMGDEFRSGLNKRTIYLSAILPVVLCILGGWLYGLPVLAVFILLPCFALLIAAVTKRRLGGITGDVLGMAVELTELFALVLFNIR